MKSFQAKNKICILTSAHNPLDDRIFYKETLSLKKAGYDVTLIAPCEKDFTRYGVRIKCVPKFKNRLERVVKTLPNVLKAALRENASIYHFHDPDLVFVGLILKIRKKKVIYDVHEDYVNQILQKDWLKYNFTKKIVSKIWEFVENKLATKYFDSIVAAEPIIYNRFKKYGEKRKSDKKILLIRNFVILSLFDKASISNGPSIPKGNKKAIFYAGGLSPHRGIYNLIKSMEYVGFRDSVLYLAGEWESEEFKTKCLNLEGAKKTVYLGKFLMEEVYNLLKQADIGIALLKKLPKYQFSLPIKIFEYMAAGIPIIASDFPYWREMFGCCAVFADPDDPKDIAQKINYLLEHPDKADELGQKGRRLVEEKYNWEKESQKLIRIYERLLNKDG